MKVDRIWKVVTSRRAQLALVCGLAGWVVSFGMMQWGGPLARHLPTQWFHTSAFWGALVAGYILAGGFGRTGRWGWALGAISACVATVLGAMIGAGTMGLFWAGEPAHGAILGVMAIADAAESHWLIATWITAMASVDAYARWVTVARLTPPKDELS